MKKYKVSSFTLFSKLTANKNHIQKDSTQGIQELLDEHSEAGWTLTATDVASFGYAMYYYLYFEKSV